jgi:hypothetical protein
VNHLGVHCGPLYVVGFHFARLLCPFAGIINDRAVSKMPPDRTAVVGFCISTGIYNRVFLGNYLDGGVQHGALLAALGGSTEVYTDSGSSGK